MDSEQDDLRKSTTSKGGRPSSIKRAATSVFNVFGGSSKKKQEDQGTVLSNPDISLEPPTSSEFNPQNLIANFPQSINKDMIINKKQLKLPNTGSGGVQGIHF